MFFSPKIKSLVYLFYENKPDKLLRENRVQNKKTTLNI